MPQVGFEPVTFEEANENKFIVYDYDIWGSHHIAIRNDLGSSG